MSDESPIVIPDETPADKSTTEFSGESSQENVSQPVKMEHLQPHFKSVPKSRVVLVQTVYHQTGHTNEPVSHGANFVRWLANEEAIYNPNRKVKVGQEWQEIDTGWVKTIGVITVINHSPKVKMKAESVHDKPGVLEVCLAPVETKEPDGGVGMWAKEKSTMKLFPHLLILPGESFPFTPVPGGKLHIRCRDGEGVYSVMTIEG